MAKFTLSALVATALWATTFSFAQAQAPRPAAGKPATASSVVGSVNGKAITWDQVFTQMRAENPDALAQVIGVAVDKRASALFGAKPVTQITLTKADVLSELKKTPSPQLANTVQIMLRNEALRQEAVKQNVNPTNADLEAYLTRMLNDAREQGQIPKEVTNDQVLAQRGLTRAKLLPQLRWQRQALNLIIKDMEKAQGHPYGPGDFVHPRHILIMVKQAPPDAKEEDKKKMEQEALDKIKAIEADIKSGKKTFEQAATESSEDGSKTKAGDLGPFARGRMVKEFENAAFSLKPGQMSEPVRSQFGFHLIKVEKTGADLSPAQRISSLDQLAQAKFGTYLQELMNQKAKVVNNLPQPPMQPGMMGTGMRPAPNMRPGTGGRPLPGNPRPVSQPGANPPPSGNPNGGN
jgi:hypothetical protein